jgi:hypothetical protein
VVVIGITGDGLPSTPSGGGLVVRAMSALTSSRLGPNPRQTADGRQASTRADAP